VAALSRYLVDCGHRVEVLAAAGSEAEPATEEGDAIAVRRVASSLFYQGGAPEALFRSLWQPAGGRAAVEALRFSGALARLVDERQARFDAVVSHWLLPCGLLASLLVRGRPHVAIAHSSDIHLVRRWRLEAAARYVAQRARLVYTCSSLRVPGAPGLVVPMGIDVAAFAADPAERQQARQRLAVHSPTVLYLGRLVEVKGLRLLLQALGDLPTHQLWLAGDGPLRDELASLGLQLGLGQRLRFFGEVRGALRRDLLLACDVLTLPSLRLPDGREEGAPQVVLEGLAAGCAVVGSDVGGVAELLGDAGWLVPPGDRAALTAALRSATAVMGDERARLEQRSVARARHFDWSVIAPQILGARLSSPRES
jgi:glycosyltransferase involved in cell wall biosynthesis